MTLKPMTYQQQSDIWVGETEDGHHVTVDGDMFAEAVEQAENDGQGDDVWDPEEWIDIRYADNPHVRVKKTEENI